MTLPDALELVAAVTLMIATAAACRWIKHNRRQWRLAVPALLWLFNAAAFIALVIVADATRIALELNVWGLSIIIHAGVTLGLYFFIGGRFRGIH
jgi:hypothetical protein